MENIKNQRGGRIFSSSQRFSASFLAVAVCFIVLFSSNLVSGANWDNVYDYDTATKTATIKNWFGLGGDLAYITLTSSHNVMVGRGVDRLVGEFNFTTTGDFKDTFGNIYLEDKRTGNEFVRGRQFKYKKYTNISVDDYETNCVNITATNGTAAQNCTIIEIGNHLKTRMDWIPIINPTNIFYQGVTYEIGVFIDVEEGDWGDWVPSIMGVEIEEWATWTEDLNANLVAYYKLNASGNDSLGVHNGTGTSDTYSPALIENGLTGVAGSGFITVPNSTDFNFDGQFSISLWFNHTPDGTDAYLFSKTSVTFTNAEEWAIFMDVPDGDVKFLTQADGVLLNSADGFDDNEFHHLLITRDGSNNWVMYIDGVSNDTASNSRDFTGIWNVEIDAVNIGGVAGNAGLDEIGIWKGRALSQSEATQLYNDGNGITYIDVFGPNITILFPQNITYNETLIELNYTATNNPDKCWFSDDGGATNSSVVEAGVNFTGLSSVPFRNNWTVFCNDTSSLITSSNVTFFVNQSVTTTLSAPTDFFNSTIEIINFSINSIPINTNLTNVTLYVWLNNGTLLLTNTTTLSGNIEVQSNFTQNISQGNYMWNAETCSIDAGCSFAAANRTLSVHTTPSTIVINFPNGTIDFFKLGENSTLNWTISEPGQNLSEHIINCSFTYNGVTADLNQSQCIEINETTFLYVAGVNNLSFEVLEEFGLTTSQTTTWVYSILENSQTFNAVVIEGANESFSINVTANEAPVSASLVYNGTITSADVDASNFPIVIISEQINIPSVGLVQNVTFFWNIVSTSTNINTTTSTQQINNLTIDNCTTNTNKIMSLTLIDEELQTAIANGTIEVAVDIFTEDGGTSILNLSGSFFNINPTEICLNINLTESGYLLNSIIRYEAEAYVNEYYNIVGLFLNNETPIQNITLFDINASDSTDFQLTFNGDDFLPVEAALIIIQRQYISENVFKTVELPKTDSNGQTVIHLERNNVIYNIIVMKNNVVLGSFTNIIAFCQDVTIGECSITLGAVSNVTAIFNYDESVGILFSQPPTFNDTTNRVSFDFTTTDGTVKTISMNVERRDIFGNNSVCTNSITSASGTVSCDIGTNLSDTSLVTTISVEGEEWLASSVEIDTTGYGNISYAMFFLMAIGVILMFSSSKNGVLLAIAISFIGAVGLGWTIGGIVGVGSAGIWILVMVIIGIWKINKRRRS